jgi:hypothetical protein
MGATAEACGNEPWDAAVLVPMRFVDWVLPAAVWEHVSSLHLPAAGECKQMHCACILSSVWAGCCFASCAWSCDAAYVGPCPEPARCHAPYRMKSCA